MFKTMIPAIFAAAALSLAACGGGGGGTEQCELFNVAYEECTGNADYITACDSYDIAAEGGGLDCAPYFQEAIDSLECDDDAMTATWSYGTCE